MTAVTTGFEYASLSQAVASRLRERADRVRTLGRQSVEAFGQIGAELLAAQAELDHGQFLRWVEGELRMSKSSAYRAMDIARNLGAELPTVGSLPLTVVHAIASSATPEPARRAILDEIKAGASVHPDAIAERVREAKQSDRKARQAEREAAAWAKLSPEEQKEQKTVRARREAAARRHDAELERHSRARYEEEVAQLEAAVAAADTVARALGDDFTAVARLIRAANYRFGEVLAERIGDGERRETIADRLVRLRDLLKLESVRATTAQFHAAEAYPFRPRGDWG